MKLKGAGGHNGALRVAEGEEQAVGAGLGFARQAEGVSPRTSAPSRLSRPETWA